MIYHRPYQLLLSSSCQLGQPNGWLKCMCGHPRVKWRLWLRQKMDSCGRAYSLIQRNVIDMLLCFIISPPAPQHIAIALPNTDIWQMSSAAATQGDMKWFHFEVVWERDSSFKRPVFIHILEELFRVFWGQRDLQRATSCLLESGFAESHAQIFIKCVI